MGVLHIILKVGHPNIISTQISEQKILMWFLSHNIPKRNKLAEQNCVRQLHPPFKMAAVTTNRNFFSCQFPLYYKSKWTQILIAAIWQWVIILKVGHPKIISTQISEQRFWCDFYHIIFLNEINWLKKSHRKTQNICWEPLVTFNMYCFEKYLHGLGSLFSLSTMSFLIRGISG
jgi:hypothetical protein